jgi:hypothetical protein
MRTALFSPGQKAEFTSFTGGKRDLIVAEVTRRVVTCTTPDGFAVDATFDPFTGSQRASATNWYFTGGMWRGRIAPAE